MRDRFVRLGIVYAVVAVLVLLWLRVTVAPRLVLVPAHPPTTIERELP